MGDKVTCGLAISLNHLITTYKMLPMDTADRHPLDIRQLVLDAEERCRPYLFETPLEYSHYLSELSGAEVWLKLDLVQKTTSFKLRGATSKIMALSEEELERGVVTASTGNYAFAVAEAPVPETS